MFVTNDPRESKRQHDKMMKEMQRAQKIKYKIIDSPEYADKYRKKENRIQQKRFRRAAKDDRFWEFTDKALESPLAFITFYFVVGLIMFSSPNILMRVLPNALQWIFSFFSSVFSAVSNFFGG